ncbi:Phospho-2-dehydro-3-deoxyheptonate aldolase [Pandoravirus macleodensis]|uniref:3-deoxy-7-phosphoheptulonate synthase n=1 Tax=Pandoravirus macleodensis TaxID=2107707 RepID=A0A2U7UGC4_9VIRU|nr:phospho-2-dehydro-3-deoxyheptonate aldolase [Pandoravirus macleodensis]AVK77514.1 Phospho-2-dehydro-3-deoxyheptonate aldolase [Pandoravirus macleodensis]
MTDTASCSVTALSSGACASPSDPDAPLASEAPRDGDATVTERLLSPRQLSVRVPADRDLARRVADARLCVRDVLAGRDPRLLVVVGPCSAHDPEAVIEYGRRLCALAAEPEVAAALVVVMRAYVEKPRTTVGWKGLASDPRLDGSCRMDEGIETSRRLLRDLVALGQPVAVEFLSPLVAPYVADLVAWGAVGARTTESQVHREMASGLGLPIGFKNGTDGSVATALDAVRAAAEPHTFMGVDADGCIAACRSTGNPDAHIVLRGSPGRPNYEASFVAAAVADAVARRMDPLPAIVIDCSHDNSAKDHKRQAHVVDAVAEQIRGGCRHVRGVMIESFLDAGRQNLPMVDGVDVSGRANVLARLRSGVSVTDACLGWDETVALLRNLASAVAVGRNVSS